MLMMKILGVTTSARFSYDQGIDLRASIFGKGDRPYFLSFIPGEKRAKDAEIKLTNSNNDSSMFENRHRQSLWPAIACLCSADVMARVQMPNAGPSSKIERAGDATCNRVTAELAVLDEQYRTNYITAREASRQIRLTTLGVRRSCLID
jgi:hypothetical protein